jgi:hypothetical protein
MCFMLQSFQIIIYQESRENILLLFSLICLAQEEIMDVEEPFQGRRRGSHGSTSHSTLPHNHPVNILYRIGVIGGSLYALHELKVFHNIVRNPDVDHQWFKIGLAATIG